jgi:hypothetical protein
MAPSSSFGTDPGLFLRSQGFPAAGLLYVSFDRGEAHGEGAGRLLALGIPPSTEETILRLRSSE